MRIEPAQFFLLVTTLAACGAETAAPPPNVPSPPIEPDHGSTTKAQPPDPKPAEATLEGTSEVVSTMLPDSLCASKLAVTNHESVVVKTPEGAMKFEPKSPAYQAMEARVNALPPFLLTSDAVREVQAWRDIKADDVIEIARFQRIGGLSACGHDPLPSNLAVGGDAWKRLVAFHKINERELFQSDPNLTDCAALFKGKPASCASIKGKREAAYCNGSKAVLLPQVFALAVGLAQKTGAGMAYGVSAATCRDETKSAQAFCKRFVSQCEGKVDSARCTKTMSRLNGAATTRMQTCMKSCDLADCLDQLFPSLE